MKIFFQVQIRCCFVTVCVLCVWHLLNKPDCTHHKTTLLSFVYLLSIYCTNVMTLATRNTTLLKLQPCKGDKCIYPAGAFKLKHTYLTTYRLYRYVIIWLLKRVSFAYLEQSKVFCMRSSRQLGQLCDSIKNIQQSIYYFIGELGTFIVKYTYWMHRIELWVAFKSIDF